MQQEASVDLVGIEGGCSCTSSVASRSCSTTSGWAWRKLRSHSGNGP
jgi:hypothetical protein